MLTNEIKKEIEKTNLDLGIKTVFYYGDEDDELGYSFGDTIYLNVTGANDFRKTNMHELLHFFEEDTLFKAVKERLIAKIDISKEREEYMLRYMGVYSKEEIEEGIIDTEIVIDILTGDVFRDIREMILEGERKNLEYKRYLNLTLRGNVKNMTGLSKWEKIFAENFYGQEDFDGTLSSFPSGKDKAIVVKKDIEKELEKLYYFGEELNNFKLDYRSDEILKEYEGEKKAFTSRGEKEMVLYFEKNKELVLREIANKIGSNLHAEYKHIVDFLKGNKKYEDSFKALMLRETLMKVYRRYSKDEKGKMSVKKRVLNSSISGHLILNETVLDIIYKRLDYYSNFADLYYMAVDVFNQKIAVKSNINIENVDTFGKGRWIKFDGKSSNPENYIENASRLSALVKDTPWCTKRLASTQLEQGDFYVFVDEKNKPHIAVKLNGNEIDEVRGIKGGNAQELEDEYRDVALSFLENNKEIEGGREWLEKEEWNKRLINYNRAILEGTISTFDIGNIMQDICKNDYKVHSEYKNSNLIELKRNLVKIKDKIAEYYDCSEEEIGFDVKFSKTDYEVCPYKVIIGDANFENSKVKKTANLTYIFGNANFYNSQVERLENLIIIGGDADFSYSKVKTFDSLTNIGGNLFLRGSEVFDLGALTHISGSAYFDNSKVITLENLISIDGDVDFTNSLVQEIGKLTSVGGQIIGSEKLKKQYENVTLKSKTL